MTIAETLHLEGVKLGQLYFDSDQQSAWFVPCRDCLHKLSLLNWSTPEEARTAVVASAEAEKQAGRLIVEGKPS